MQKRFVHFLAGCTLVASLASCGNNAPTTEGKKDSTKTFTITEDTVDIQADSVVLKSVVAYSSDTSVKKPIVLIVPEWWGLDGYVKGRAQQLAALGYFAVGIDMYGNGKVADNPGLAGELAGAFYKNPQLWYSRLQAALAKAKTYPGVDTSKVAAIGYCFGGSAVLNSAKLGLPVNGVVSFHGGLAGVTPAKGQTKADILVCHGMADSFVPAADVATFKKQLDSVGASYTFKEYPDATHAFTNPNATEKGKKFNMPIRYNGAADSASFNDMKVFFDKIFK
ncbi:Dienelactone hydrolase [Filimonas lacunae]|uniref:Dienelactone hydrolase n=1 Tax=Filimonas lacunae TaxID=477680 RepID=A0A173MAD2_9BACT|nr:dienelactone hydrolase family protein [Filimonas lacunae]BAV04492.1 dienelactone hydrolase [Filimonas lacunae]SIT31574.1 Dienelactone hydrolase [Filimonas lacunae]